MSQSEILYGGVARQPLPEPKPEPVPVPLTFMQKVEASAARYKREMLPDMVDPTAKVECARSMEGFAALATKFPQRMDVAHAALIGVLSGQVNIERTRRDRDDADYSEDRLIALAGALRAELRAFEANTLGWLG